MRVNTRRGACTLRDSTRGQIYVGVGSGDRNYPARSQRPFEVFIRVVARGKVRLIGYRRIY